VRPVPAVIDSGVPADPRKFGGCALGRSVPQDAVDARHARGSAVGANALEGEKRNKNLLSMFHVDLFLSVAIVPLNEL
jgi:hypothetical protein